MHRHRSILITAAAALVGAAVASCGGTSGPASRSRAATTVTGVLGTASTPLGRVLVDHGGRTVYLLTADGPGSSSCDAACLHIWPPVPAPGRAAPAPVSGIPARLGVARSSGGAVMLTAAGRPLYTFAQDTAPGQVNGQRQHKLRRHVVRRVTVRGAGHQRAVPGRQRRVRWWRRLRLLNWRTGR